LNIEFTYQQKMGQYEEFKNICLVDTLDHCGFEGKQFDLFAMSVQNTARIQEQNNRMISVIIGNPPYNANQERENDNNRNRSYDEVDKQIRRTYVAESTAQKMKIYDIYARFFRWATSRLDENGVFVFITNSYFINARGFDGFRKVVAEEFSDIYVIDLGGDVRKNPKLSGTKHNVFGIQAGVAISFMVKQHKNGKSKCKIFYSRRPEFDTAEQKLEFLYHTKIEGISFKHISPDNYNNWLDQAEHEFDDLIRVCSKEARASDDDSDVETIFKLYSIGISTNRDEWVYDFDAASLEKKAKFFMDEYNHEVDRWKKYKQQNKYVDIKKESNPVVDKFLEERGIIKWSKMIKRDKLRKDKKEEFKSCQIARAAYRPYCARFLYFDYIPIDIFGNQLEIFGADKTNCVIACNASSGGTKPFGVLATNQCVDLHLIGDTICIPLYRYDENGNRIDNITDWGLTQFQTHYNDPSITKENIFHYTYSVLHHPAYRKKYGLNLKREFPRLPFYDKFFQWVEWGKQLMDLHLKYETIEPYN
jgi:predicted helicase